MKNIKETAKQLGIELTKCSCENTYEVLEDDFESKTLATEKILQELISEHSCKSFYDLFCYVRDEGESQKDSDSSFSCVKSQYDEEYCEMITYFLGYDLESLLSDVIFKEWLILKMDKKSFWSLNKP